MRALLSKLTHNKDMKNNNHLYAEDLINRQDQDEIDFDLISQTPWKHPLRHWMFIQTIYVKSCWVLWKAKIKGFCKKITSF